MNRSNVGEKYLYSRGKGTNYQKHRPYKMKIDRLNFS